MTVLHLFGCSAPPVLHIQDAVTAAHRRGWDVCLGLTPIAADWVGPESLAGLAAATGRPVRVEPRRPGQRHEPWPAPDVVAAAPTTLNTLNAVALGLTPSYAASALVEAVGARTPLVLLPCVKATLAAHPQLERSVALLRDAGVRVLYGPGGWVPNEPGAGTPERYPWHLVLDAATAALAGRRRE